MLLPMTPGKTAKLAATTTSAATALPAAPVADGGFKTAAVYNAGSVVVAVAFGGSSVAAADSTSSFAADCHFIPPGNVSGLVKFTIPSTATHIAVKTESSTANVYVTLGEGV